MHYSDVSTDDTLRELREHGSLRYPFQLYHDYFNLTDLMFTSLHWHQEYELVYLKEGALNCRVCCSSFTLKAGQALWIAPGMLHSYSADTSAEAISLLFLPELFATEGSLLHERYVQPIRTINAEHCLMDGSAPWHSDAIQLICSLISVWENNAETKELDVQTHIARFWSLLFRNTDSLVKGCISEATMRMQARFIAMTDFITENYQHKLMLEQIARAANISRSEALRCFRTLAGQTPVEYLMNYRLRQARHMLLSTEKSISDVAASSGFESMTYFDRVFRRSFGCTPREMRRKSMKRS